MMVTNKGLPLTRGLVTVQASLCDGCRTCETVCALVHGGASDPEVSRILVTADFLDVDFSPLTCLQCSDPLCLEACPVSAIAVDEATVARVVVESECIACSACVDACGAQFDPPRIRLHPRTQIALKCDLCAGDPQCVRFCPTGALTYTQDSAGIPSGHGAEVKAHA